MRGLKEDMERGKWEGGTSEEDHGGRGGNERDKRVKGEKKLNEDNENMEKMGREDEERTM